MRLHRFDLVGVAVRAAADDSRPARGVRSAVRRRRRRRRSAPSRRREDRSIIDADHGGGRAPASNELGPADRARLADYLDDVREIERRIQRVEAQNASGEPRELPGAPKGVPDSFEEHVKLMFDLQALAFASDLTRVSAFKLSRDVSGRVYKEAGVTTGFHNASHHDEREDRIKEFAKINRYHVSLVPYFLERLKNTPDGDAQPAHQQPDRLRLADGQSERAQPQALPAVPGRPRRRRAQGRPAPQGADAARRWPTSSSPRSTCSASTRWRRFGDSTGEFELNAVAPATTAVRGARWRTQAMRGLTWPAAVR